MLSFTRGVLALRRRYAVFRTGAFLPGQEAAGSAAHWIRVSGGVMTEADWHDRGRHSIAVLLETDVQQAGEPGAITPIGATRIALLLNGGGAVVQQQLPVGRWRLMLDTARPGAESESLTGAVDVAGFSVVLLEQEATSRSLVP